MGGEWEGKLELGPVHMWAGDLYINPSYCIFKDLLAENPTFIQLGDGVSESRFILEGYH